MSLADDNFICKQIAWNWKFYWIVWARAWFDKSGKTDLKYSTHAILMSILGLKAYNLPSHAVLFILFYS